MFRKLGKAREPGPCFKCRMYRNDTTTGETEFALESGDGAREVVLEGFSENGQMRVPMRREARGWVTRVAVAPGWFFYRFCIDGRARWDRTAGKVRTADGTAWSLALIHAGRITATLCAAR